MMYLLLALVQFLPVHSYAQHEQPGYFERALSQDRLHTSTSGAFLDTISWDDIVDRGSIIKKFSSDVDLWCASLSDALLHTTKNDLFLNKMHHLCKRVYGMTTHAQSIEILQDAVRLQVYLHKNSYKIESEQELLDYFFCAFLAKNMVPLVRSALATIVGILDDLHDLEMYWTKQERHPLRYYFHKSPVKWFSKETQRLEVQHNKLFVHRIMQHYNSVLGQLVYFLHSFDPHVRVDKQYDWMCSLIDIMSLMVGRPQGNKATKNLPNKHFDYLAHAMIHQGRALQQHHKRVLLCMDQAKKPGHFTRNWIIYACIASLGAYCYLDPQLIISTSFAAAVHWWYKKDAEGNTFVKRWFEKPVKELKDVLGGLPPEKWGEQDKDILKIDELEAVRENLDRQLAAIKEHNDVLSAQLDASEKNLHDNIAKIVNRFAAEKSEHERAQILSQVLAANIDELTLLTTTPYVGLDGYKPALKDLEPFKLQLLDILALKVNAIELGIRKDLRPTIAAIDENLLKLQTGALQSIIDSAQVLNKTSYDLIHWIMNAIYDLLKNNNLSIKILALAPAGLTSYAGYKGLATVWKRLFAVNNNYHQCNMLLCDIQKVLINLGHEPNYSFEGELLHLAIRLRRALIALRAPIKSSYRTQFLADLKDLESCAFTPQEKEKLVAVMRQRYPFLTERAVK